jgi:hypothetical protein
MEINMDDVDVNIKSDVDLQEETRMWDAYDQMQTLVAMLGEVSVFPSLVWLWAWDTVVDLCKNNQPGVDDEYVVNMPLHDIWKLFYTQADKNGFTLEYGTEDLYEHIRDWMIDEDILQSIEDAEEEDADE